MLDKSLVIAMIGDVVGDPGIAMAEQYFGDLRSELSLDAIIVNGENSAHNGKGVSEKSAERLFAAGADVITTGNHVWAQKDVVPFMQSATKVLRPSNFPVGVPGVGVTTINVGAYAIGVINVQGRVFMRELLDCPFRSVDKAIASFQGRAHAICVDFHAETTAEKAAMAHYLDGRVSAVVGTHTHIQTADERVLPKGTAFITDLGMGGALNSSLGMKKEPIITNLLTSMPIKFEVDKERPFVLSGAVIYVDPSTGKATDIQRIRIIEE